MPLSLTNPWVIIGLLLILAGTNAATAYKTNEITTERVDAKWIKEYAALEQKKDAVIAAANQRFMDAEASNLTKTQDWEKKDNEREKYIQGLRLANGRLVDATCGMFDRNGRPTGGGGADPGSVAASSSLSSQGRPSICNLPDEVRQIVQRFGRGLGDLLLEADLAASEAITGHELAVEVDAFRAQQMERNRTVAPH